MDRFKLRVGDPIDMPIDQSTFETSTHRGAPWVQNISRTRQAYRAVCPACDNSIVLVNLYTDQERSKRPHGRHIKHTVPGLATYSQARYDCCPLAAPSNFGPNHRRSNDDPQSRRILRQLIEQFDRVVAIFQQFTGIRMSGKLARTMLEDYQAADGHLYRHAHMLNIPWMFAYMGNRQQTLYGRRVFNNPTLQAAVAESVSGADWTDDRLTSVATSGSIPFLEVAFFFLDHRSRKRDQVVTEHITLAVVDNHRPYDDALIFEQTIPIDTGCWSDLVATPRRNPGDRFANSWIALAREILDPRHDLTE